MPRNQTKGSLALAGFDDIFNVATPQKDECIQMLPLTGLHTPDPEVNIEIMLILSDTNDIGKTYNVELILPVLPD